MEADRWVPESTKAPQPTNVSASPKAAKTQEGVQQLPQSNNGPKFDRRLVHRGAQLAPR